MIHHRYRRVKSRTFDDAVMYARNLCPCERASFAGVELIDMQGKIRLITWADIDSAVQRECDNPVNNTDNAS